MSSSRISKSIQNAKVALVFYFLNLVLQFFSRKIFLDYLGSEVLGLNTTAQNLLGFLNLAELGYYGKKLSMALNALKEKISKGGFPYRVCQNWTLTNEKL